MLQDGADVSAGRINHQTDMKVRLRVLELGDSGQGSLGGVEGLLHRGRPIQGLARSLKRVGQRKKKTGCTSQEPVEINEAKETLKIWPYRLAWKLDNCLHVARERADSRGRNSMSQKLDLLLAEDGLLVVDGETILA